MSNKESDNEGEFLVAGAKTYLDVDDAMEQFRRLVQDHCTAMLSKRIDEVNRICKMDWTPNDLKDYKWRQPDSFHIGKHFAIENFGGLYICLELNREKDGMDYATVVYLWRQRRDLARDLWDRLHSAPSDGQYCEGNSLIFQRPLSEDKIPSFLEYLNLTLNDFIAFIEGSGGLKKYLP